MSSKAIAIEKKALSAVTVKIQALGLEYFVHFAKYDPASSEWAFIGANRPMGARGVPISREELDIVKDEAASALMQTEIDTPVCCERAIDG